MMKIAEEIPMGLRFSILHRAFRQKMNELLGERELTGVQLGVMHALIEQERSSAGEICQKDLENATHVTHPTMTEIIKRREKKGFISCRPSAVDRRYKSVASTDRACGLCGELAALDAEVFEWLCRGLSAAQKEQLTQITDIMLANAAECCGKGCDDRFDQKACAKHKGI